MKKIQVKKLETAKYRKAFQKHFKGLTTFSIIIFIVLMLAGSYYVLFMLKDKTAITAGEKRLKELNINFDQKTIEELEGQQGPTTIQGASGQNPFSPL